MKTEQLTRLTSLKVFSEPFHYFTATEGFGPHMSSVILEWLETAQWEYVKAEFYEQYEFNIFDIKMPPDVKFLIHRSFLDDLRVKMEGIFDIQLGQRIDCTAHKLVQGQRIRIHNDFISGEETHRFLVQLNRGWNDEQGGFLMLFNSQDPSEVHKVISPDHDTAVGFVISKDSYHAVSTIHGGERFTLVFSFYAGNDS